MSYDLMVFDPTKVPVEREAFLAWYASVTDWDESKDYNDPARATQRLQAWYHQVSSQFPSILGVEGASSEDEESRYSDYTIDHHAIYIAFAWSQAEQAYAAAKVAAAEHHVGLFNVSSPSTEVYLVNDLGRLIPVSADLDAVDPYHYAIWKRSPTTKTAMLNECYAAIEVADTHEAMAPFAVEELKAEIEREFLIGTDPPAGALRLRVNHSDSASWIRLTTTSAAKPEVLDFILPAALERSLMVYDPQQGAVWGNRRPPKPPKKKRA